MSVHAGRESGGVLQIRGAARGRDAVLGVLDLWMPILVFVVLVFVASSFIHMVFKTHHSDYRQLPGEEDAMA